MEFVFHGITCHLNVFHHLHAWESNRKDNFWQHHWYIIFIPSNQFWNTVWQDPPSIEAFITAHNADNVYLWNQPDLQHPFFSKFENDGMSDVRESFGKQFNMPSGVSDRLINYWSEGTAKQHAPHFWRWFGVGSENGLGLINADITNGDEFLTFLFLQQLMDLPFGNSPTLKQLSHFKLLNMISSMF